MALPDITVSGGPPPEFTNTDHRVRFALPATSASVAEARCRVHRTLGVWRVPANSRDAAALVVSELVTNAVVHTDTRTVTCVLAATGHQVLIQVEDHGTGLTRPTLHAAAPREERGRGLMLVAAVSRCWGSTAPDNEAGGQVVWATLNVATE
ncbi:ATP-binding protein [Streptomyces sp. 4F14]|uniref:ATP-binding protein n=1 Tax=Streptomyces sp. 4F14 TaxID=3394380 RepID=UPI003A8836AB